MRSREVIPIIVLTISLLAICVLAIISQLDVSKYDTALISSTLNNDEFTKNISIANIALLQAQVYWAALSAFLAGLGSLATAAGIIFVAAQLRITRQQLDRDRAYVHYNGMKWLSFCADRVNTDNWGIIPLWINSGATPALDVELWYGAAWLEGNQFPDFDASRREVHKTTVRPGGHMEMSPVFLQPSEIMSPVENSIYCVWGEARYRDVFARDAVRVTRFCVKLMNYSGDPTKEWNAIENPVHLGFVNVGPNFVT